jgi:iron complex outermembrane recepter protein
VQWALYGESYLPFSKTFDVRLAGRYDHYDDFGGDFNPSVGLRWRPTDSFLVRGGWNSSFRAPSLAQSGAGITLSSGSLPCANGSEFFASFCGGFAGDDGYLTEIYGNADLKAETSSAWYLGTVFELGATTTLKLDYFDITQRNLVDVDALDLFRQALRNPALVVDEGQLGFGQLGIETRGGTLGDPVENVNLQLINVGRQQTSGLDISFTHDRETAHWGRFRLYADATWTRSFERTESCSPTDATTRRGAGACVNGQRLVDFTGEFRYPEWLVNTGVSWKNGDWSSRVWANYTDGYYDDDQRDGVPANRRIASSTIFNASVSWDVTTEGYVTLTLRNLFDREAPLALGSATNVDQFNHDTLGRAYTLSYTQRF